MTPNPVPSIPSREAVAFSQRVLRECAQHLAAQGSKEAIGLFGEISDQLDVLIAKVERLTDQNKRLCEEISRSGAIGLAFNNMKAERDSLRATVSAQAAALQTIVDWQTPKTGKFHPDGNEMSYGWCYGSNGERDHFREIARATLAQSASQMDAPRT
jgi:hypothetical protein